MAGVNRVMLLGNLGQEPQVRQTQGGSPVAKLRLATNESWRDRVSGELKTSTEWHNIVAFGKTAEMVDRFLAKGSLIYVEGRLQTRKWQDQSGADRYTIEILAQTIQLLDRASGEEQPHSPETRQDEASDGPYDFSKCPF